MNPLVNPVAVAVVLLVVLLFATGVDYATYFEGAQFVHFLLGPATVALAVPLYANFAAVRRAALPMALALISGSATAVVSAVGIAAVLGGRSEEHKSELQSLMRISYAVFCLNTKKAKRY